MHPVALYVLVPQQIGMTTGFVAPKLLHIGTVKPLSLQGLEALPQITEAPADAHEAAVDSVVHVALQPSPEVVFLSSHCSVPSILPSPQTGVYALPFAF